MSGGRSSKPPRIELRACRAPGLLRSSRVCKFRSMSRWNVGCLTVSALKMSMASRVAGSRGTSPHELSKPRDWAPELREGHHLSVAFTLA